MKPSSPIVCAAVLVLASTLAGCREEEPLPEMLPLGEFALLDQEGRPFGLDDLRGKVSVVSFIFTSCPDICPVLTSQMANLHRRVHDDDVRFVSVSVDPAQDTPARLREYAGQFRADPSRWSFLTTDQPEQMRGIIESAFRMPSGERQDRGDGRYDILHSPRFLLVDRRGVLRGLYETDAAGLERLERDIGRLRGEGS